MVLELKRAQRSKAFLKLGISAPSGGGKTLGALLIAYGLMKEKYPDKSDAFRWAKIAIIDTENGSGELYVGRDVAGIVIGEYNAITLTAPFEADKYTQAITLCENNDIEVGIIDSSTHLWSGEGGLLEQQGAAAKRSGNSYTAWRDITPQHNRFVEKMLQSKIHIIATMRSKQEYVQEKGENNKTVVRKLGMEPEQRKGMEYEFTIFFEINSEHEAFGAKDRTSIYDQKTFKITPEIGVTLMKWLDSGVDTKSVVLASNREEPPAQNSVDMVSMKRDVVGLCAKLGGKDNKEVMALVNKYSPAATPNNPNSITDAGKLQQLYDGLVKLEETTETN